MILVIDNYDSFTYNLVHLVALGTEEVRVFRNDAVSIDDVRRMDPAGILISPGPGRPGQAGISENVIREFGDQTPILGVCLGHQAIGEVFGGQVTHAPSLMHGKTSEIQHDGQTIFEGLAQGFVATRYHSLVIERSSVPSELEVSAETVDGVVMGLRHRRYPIEGIQFHPESILTVEGPRLIRNWLAAVSHATTGRPIGDP